MATGKTTSRRTGAKKTTAARKSGAKRKATTKTATSKRTAKKTTAKRTTARKATTKKAGARKAAAKKATARTTRAPARGGSPARAGSPVRRTSSGTLRVRRGDVILIDSAHVGSPPREGVVQRVIQGETSVRYEVRWPDGHETLISPEPSTVSFVRS